MIYAEQLIDEFAYTNAVNPTTEYNPLTTYGIGDESRVDSIIYKSTLDNNLGNNPLNNLDGYWLEWDVANDYAMLDLEEETTTDFIADGIVEFTRGGIDTIGVGNFNASLITIEYLELLNGVISGLTIDTSVDLNSSILEGLIYVNDVRIDFTTTAKLFTASKDTYVDINDSGIPIYTEVTNGAIAPTLTAPNQRIAIVETDVDNITAITDLRTVINPILDTDIYTFTSNGNVWDVWSYGYGGFTDITTKTIYTNIKRIGTKIRVTFAKNGLATFCGFMIAGIAVDMGRTLDKVSFPYRKIGNTVLKESSFSTIVDKGDLIRKERAAKKLTNVAMLFVVDNNENSSHDSMIILGKIFKVDSVAENNEKNRISWTIQENIQE